MQHLPREREIRSVYNTCPEREVKHAFSIGACFEWRERQKETSIYFQGWRR